MCAFPDVNVLVADFERDARTIETEKLSKHAHAALKRMRSQVSTLQSALEQMLEQLKEAKAFSPEEAGQRIVAELQKAEGGAYSGVELRSKWDLTAAVLHRRRKEHRIVYWRDSNTISFTRGGNLPRQVLCCPVFKRFCSCSRVRTNGG